VQGRRLVAADETGRSPDAVGTPAMFTRIRAIDLRPQKFPDLAIARTSVVRLAGGVIRDDLGARRPFTSWWTALRPNMYGSA
jgi:hypothetical protein